MAMTPLIRIDGISNDQLADIKDKLSQSGIKFAVDSSLLPREQFIRVPKNRLEDAQRVVRIELAEYAVSKRAEWDREYREKHGGSYFRWLSHQLTSKARETAARVFNAIF